MTVPVGIERNDYPGTGAQVIFDYTFQIFDQTELRVIETVDATGVVTDLVLTTHYSVQGVNVLAGGTITRTVATPVGTTISILSAVAYAQSTQLKNQGRYFPQTVERAFDRVVRMIKQVVERLNRTIQVPESEFRVSPMVLPAKAVRKSKFMACDANGDIIASSGTSPAGGVIVTVFAETFLDDADGLAVTATIGAISKTIVDAKGDLIAATAADVVARVPVGADGYVLSADSSQASGLLWISNYPKSLAPNPFFEADQLAVGALANADDVYAHDHWYTLNQTANIAVTQQTLQENGQRTNARLTQTSTGGAGQRMGYACIIEASESQKYRGQTMTLKPRIRCSISQQIRCALLEWTGAADAVTSDVVNDWTSVDYGDGAGRFFVDANISPVAVGAVTPGANVWTDFPGIFLGLSANVNNIILLIWTSGSIAQNATLDIGKVRLVQGPHGGEIYIPTLEEVLAYAERFYETSFPRGVFPQQAVGNADGAFHLIQSVGAAVATHAPSVPFRTRKRAAPAVTLYNPISANSAGRNLVVNADWGAQAVVNPSDVGFAMTYTTGAGSAAGNRNAVHWAADSRL